MADQDENQDQQQDKEDQQNEKEDQRKGKGVISYTFLLVNGGKTIIFSLDKQAPEVTDYLVRYGFFKASNGIFIYASYDYSFSEELNKIYLDEGVNDIPFNKRPQDVSYFDNSNVAKGKITAVDFALEEFVDEIKKIYDLPRRSSKTKTQTKVIA